MNIKIANTEIYGITRAMESAGLPKSDGKTVTVPKAIYNLGQAVAGSGHDCFLKGIIVQARITADHAFWLQWQRYHFQDVVSSTSKMHTLGNITPEFHSLVDWRVVDIFKELQDEYTDEPTPENFERLVVNTPIGMMLTADITTNYLQLKTTYAQRKTHKMSSWREYCKWTEELPKFLELTQKTL